MPNRYHNGYDIPPFRHDRRPTLGRKAQHCWKSEEEVLFVEKTIAKRLERCTWEELSEEEARAAPYVSREFLTPDSDGKLRAVADLKYISEHFLERRTKCDTLEASAALIRKGDRMLAFDLEAGYHQFRLHPLMRQYFVVQFGSRYFRYIGLPFGWRHSGYWFIRLTSRFTTLLRSKLGFRVIHYVDDFLILPSVGRPSSRRDCLRASRLISRLLKHFGLRRHPEKGVWGGGSTCMTHLGFVIDTVRCRFGVPARKVDKVVSMAKLMMQAVRRNRRQISKSTVLSFAGTCSSLSLAVPDTRFHLRGLHDVLSQEVSGKRGLVRLSNQAA